MSVDEEKDLFDTLYSLVSTVLYVEEKTPEEIRRHETFLVAKKNVDAFFAQINEKLSLCTTEEEMSFVTDTTINFLIFSLKKMVVDFDCPDENIEYLANHLRDQILSVTRKSHNQRRSKK